MVCSLVVPDDSRASWESGSYRSYLENRCHSFWHSANTKSYASVGSEPECHAALRNKIARRFGSKGSLRLLINVNKCPTIELLTTRNPSGKSRGHRKGLPGRYRPMRNLRRVHPDTEAPARTGVLREYKSRRFHVRSSFPSRSH